MKVKFWGTRGSIPSAGAETWRYGGNTSCVEVRIEDRLIILDAGTGIRDLGNQLKGTLPRIDLLLTHLHMDHILGMGFFVPFFNPQNVIHIWGPASYNETLENRLTRYLSPPLFPVRFRDLPCTLHFHEIARDEFFFEDLKIRTDYVCHPGPTIGYRLESKDKVLTYLPDHEPALGAIDFPHNLQWTSGFDLAKNADVLIHDAQFTGEEYPNCVGWGHSSFKHALDFASITNAASLRFFHHNPGRTDQQIKAIEKELRNTGLYSFDFGAAREGDSFVL